MATLHRVDSGESVIYLKGAVEKTVRLCDRMLAADGSERSDVTLPQFYNDQFYANTAGQVTYKNGAVVYVNPTFTAARPTVPGCCSHSVAGHAVNWPSVEP